MARKKTEKRMSDNAARGDKPKKVKSLKRSLQRGPINKVPPRIIRKVVVRKAPENEYQPIDIDAAAAFAMSIAQQMKHSEAQAEVKRHEDDIRLSRRPTTRSQGEQTEKFPDSDLKDFRRRLNTLRAKALTGVTAMKATGFSNQDDIEADGGDGTNQTLKLQALGQVGNINRMIQQIDEALHRIDDGTYGVCTQCGQLIRKPRLLNQPFVLTCMECQNEMERAQR